MFQNLEQYKDNIAIISDKDEIVTVSGSFFFYFILRRQG